VVLIFGFQGILSSKNLTIDLDLLWPYIPSSDGVFYANGTVKVNIKDGQITAIDPIAGKVLGLLSIAELPKRLVLDFSDIFKKGLSFNRLSGEFQFKQGSAWYLNLSPIKYWSSVLRLSHFGENWRAVVSEILNEAGLKPRVRIVKENNFPGMVESLFWKNGQDIYLGIIANPSDGLESVKGKSGQITLIFGKRICAINLRSGQKFQKVKIIKDDFLPWEGNVYKIKF
jgi:hypothetical protein